MPLSQHEEPDSNNISSSSQERYLNSPKSCDNSKSFADHETAPLLDTSPSTEFQRARRHTNDSLRSAFGLDPDEFESRRIEERRQNFHSSDESYFFDLIMEKVKSTKIAHFVDKLAVESEPGLTNAQLMLNNHDLKPVEPERRQWGPWNFVGFWVADSFNIVSFHGAHRSQ
jgi:nucleobase:cation symporter-1, NCS1 family